MASNLIDPYQLIVKNFDLLINGVKSDIQQKYAGSVLGLFWLAIYPIFLFFIYSALYILIFKVKPSDMSTNTYVIYIMSGLLPFLSFSEALSSGTTSLSTNKSLLLNTLYPGELIPLQAVISSHVMIVFGLAILMLASILLRVGLSFYIFFVPIVIVSQIVFVTGIVWVLSILNLVLKDIQQALTFLTMLLMIASPIAYTPSMVPSVLKPIMYLNPFSYFIWCYQDFFVRGTLTINFFVMILISAMSFAVGFLFYHQSKKVFYEFA